MAPSVSLVLLSAALLVNLTTTQAAIFRRKNGNGVEVLADAHEKLPRFADPQLPSQTIEETELAVTVSGEFCQPSRQTLFGLCAL